MIISHRLKYVFIHIPKTGGTSIRKALLNNSKFCVDEISCSDHHLIDPHETQVVTNMFNHVTVDDLKKYFKEKNWDWSSYYKFAFVRNPYDLNVSNFFYYHQKLKHQADVSLKLKEYIEKQTDFKTYIKSLERWNAGAQARFVCKSSNVGVNFLGKFESIEEDYKHIVSSILPKSIIEDDDYKLEHTNSTIRTEYEKYYTPELLKVVNRVCSEDFKLGNYKTIIK